jgi:hypothetical protein
MVCIAAPEMPSAQPTASAMHVIGNRSVQTMVSVVASVCPRLGNSAAATRPTGSSAGPVAISSSNSPSIAASVAAPAATRRPERRR